MEWGLALFYRYSSKGEKTEPAEGPEELNLNQCLLIFDVQNSTPAFTVQVTVKVNGP